MAAIKLKRATDETAAEVAAVSRASRNVGAIVTFTGLCRDEDGRLSGRMGRPAEQAVQDKDQDQERTHGT